MGIQFYYSYWCDLDTISLDMLNNFPTLLTTANFHQEFSSFFVVSRYYTDCYREVFAKYKLTQIKNKNRIYI